MQITSNPIITTDTQTTNLNFKSKKQYLNTVKKLSDNTIAKISAAVTSTAIASIMIENKKNDFVQVSSKEAILAGLKEEDQKSFAKAFNEVPILIDTILTTKNKAGKTRTISSENLSTLTDSYFINPELTEKLITEMDKDNNFKFSTQEISYLVNANEINPELYEISRANPTFANKLIQIKNAENKPTYGYSDIKNYLDIYEADEKLVSKMITQKNKKGDARFNGEQAKNIILSRIMGDKSYIDDLINMPIIWKNSDSLSKHRFDGEDIIKLIEINPDSHDKEVIKNLSQEGFYTDYGDYIGALSADEIVDIIKLPADKVVTKYGQYGLKKMLIKILELRNKDINNDEYSNIINLRNNIGYPILSSDDLTSFCSDTKETGVSLSDVKNKYFDRKLTEKGAIKIQKIAHNYPELISSIMDKTYTIKLKHGRTQDIKFNNTAVFNLIELGEKQPELVTELVSRVEGADLSDFYVTDTSKTLTYIIESVVKNTDHISFSNLNKLLKATKKDKNGNDIPAYSIIELRDIISTLKKYPNLTLANA